MDRSHILRPHTGADILRHVDHVDGGPHWDAIEQLAMSDSGWAAALIANPECPDETAQRLAVRWPNGWTLLHLIEAEQGGQHLPVVMKFATPEMPAVWVAAIAEHPQQTERILKALLGRYEEIPGQVAEYALDVVVHHQLPLAGDVLAGVLAAVSSRTAVKLCAQYHAQLDAELMAEAVEAYYGQLSLPDHCSHVEMLLYLRPDVFELLYKRREQYGSVARGSLEMQVVLSPRKVSRSQLNGAVAWCREADGDEAAAMLPAFRSSHHLTCTQYHELHSELHRRHHERWGQSAVMAHHGLQTPRRRPSTYYDLPAELRDPKKARSDYQFELWQQWANNERPGLCTALLANRHLAGYEREVYQREIREYRRCGDHLRWELRDELGPRPRRSPTTSDGAAKRDSQRGSVPTPARLRIRHLKGAVSNFQSGNRRHRAVCTKFATAMLARYGTEQSAWQAALNLVDVLDDATPVSELLDVVAQL